MRHYQSVRDVVSRGVAPGLTAADRAFTCEYANMQMPPFTLSHNQVNLIVQESWQSPVECT